MDLLSWLSPLLAGPWLAAAPVATLTLAVGCGMATTLAGQGGGMLLLLGLAALHGPTLALQISAPALLIGNAHRLHAMRAALDRPLALRLGGGAFLGSAVGGAAAMHVPRGALLVTMVAMVAFGLAKRAGLAIPTPKAAWLPVLTFATGLVCAVGGGAGLLVAPLLMSLGLRGERYVATAAAVAVAMHLGRIVGYRAGGGLSAEVVSLSLPLALALVAGNAAALPLRRLWSAAQLQQLEVAALVTVALAALMCGL